MRQATTQPFITPLPSSPTKTTSPLLAHESALALLDRSIRFGHERLALIRLVMAVHAGAEIPLEHWTYCKEVVRRNGHAELKGTLLEALATAERDGRSPVSH